MIGAMFAGAAATAMLAAVPPGETRPPSAFGYAARARQCAGKDGWSDPAPPTHIYANLYDVGTCGIVVLLVTGPAGHILIDAATADAAPATLANIRRLGFRPGDVKLLLVSHEHADHVGGLRAIQRATGATLLARTAARAALKRGVPAMDDPQRGDLPNFAGARVGGSVRDGQVVRLGPLRLTAHATPGHAPGSTSWSWRSCTRTGCRAVVYADSLSAVSTAAYRFSDHPAYVAAFRASIAAIARLPCDLIVTPHPGASDLYPRLAGAAPLRDRAACVAYAATARANLDRRLAAEAAQPAPATAAGT